MFESCICLNPDELCQVLSSAQPRARMVHQCGECRHDIQPGDVYERDVTIFDGEIETHKTCLTFVRIRDSLFDCVWYYGRIWEDIHESHCGFGEDDDFCICPEPVE